MNKELKNYLQMMGVLVLFWFCGSIVDTALWKHETYMTPAWFIRNLQFFWLVGSQFLAPLLLVITLKPKLNTVIAFFSVGCFSSLLWDLLYFKLTRGQALYDMYRWFDLGDTGLVINIVGPWVLIFHILRLITSILLFYWLYHRIRRE